MYKKILLVLLLLSITSCEEVIKVELDNADPQLVIEANVSDNPNNNFVKITRSTNFYNPSEYEDISGAEITVSEINGDSFTFSETSPGKYINTNLNSKLGYEYKITVNYEDETYSAISELHKKIMIDSLGVEGKIRPFGNQNNLRYEFHCYFQDNLGVEDFARFRVFVNGVRDNGIIVYEDRLTDGNYIDFNRFQVQNDEDDPLKPGDVVTIELLTIDKVTFEYFDTLRDVLASSSGGGPSGGTAPANPTTNWDNDALGYFSAYSIDSQTLIIK